MLILEYDFGDEFEAKIAEIQDFKAVEDFNTESSAGFIKIDLGNEADKTLVVSLSKSEKPASAMNLHYHIIRTDDQP